jgi:hypothetical protein
MAALGLRTGKYTIFSKASNRVWIFTFPCKQNTNQTFSFFLKKQTHPSHLVGSLGNDDFLSGPPGHVGGGLDQVVTEPTRNGQHGHGLRNKLLLPADLGQHGGHFVGNFVVALLSVLGNIAVHLVDSDNQLLDSEQVDEQGVLAGLALHFSGLQVSLGNGGDKVSVGGHHQQGNVGLGRSSDHVLDEISVSRSINDGVVLGLSEELLGGASNGHSALALVLLTVHVKGKGKGALSESVGFLAQLLHLALVDSSEIEDQTTSGGGLSGIDVAADDDRNVLLSLGRIGHLNIYLQKQKLRKKKVFFFF